MEISYGAYIGMTLASVGGSMPTREEAVQMYMEFYNRYAIVITLVYQMITFLIICLIFRIKKKSFRKEVMLTAIKREYM